MVKYFEALRVENGTETVLFSLPPPSPSFLWCSLSEHGMLSFMCQRQQVGLSVVSVFCPKHRMLCPLRVGMPLRLVTFAC